MLSLSSWSRRNRPISSSVNDDFPDPPVPVTPSVAPGRATDAARSSVRTPGSTRASSSAVIIAASTGPDPLPVRSATDGAVPCGGSQALIIEATMPSRPMRAPSAGENNLVTP